MDALTEAKKQIDDYDNRANSDSAIRDERDALCRLMYEDRAYKRAMMQAAIAQAEAATRQAAALERIADALAFEQEQRKLERLDAELGGWTGTSNP